jgi:hypothetical protein
LVGIAIRAESKFAALGLKSKVVFKGEGVSGNEGL